MRETLQESSQAAESYDGRVRRLRGEVAHPCKGDGLLRGTGIGYVCEFGDLKDRFTRRVHFIRTGQCYLVVLRMFFQVRRAGHGSFETTLIGQRIGAGSILVQTTRKGCSHAIALILWGLLLILLRKCR